MRVLGIETSCDETGVAVYDTRRRSRSPTRCTPRSRMHAAYGGVVPELASRDHVRHLVPLIEAVLAEAATTLADLDGIAYTEGPGPRRRIAGRGQRRHRPCLRAGHARDRHPPPGRAPAVAPPVRSAPGLPVCRAARFGRAQPTVRGRGRRALPAPRRHAGRRRGRGVRQDREAARPAVPRRTGARAPRRVRPRRRRQPAAADARLRRPRHELLAA